MKTCKSWTCAKKLDLVIQSDRTSLSNKDFRFASVFLPANYVLTLTMGMCERTCSVDPESINHIVQSRYLSFKRCVHAI